MQSAPGQVPNASAVLLTVSVFARSGTPLATSSTAPSAKLLLIPTALNNFLSDISTFAFVNEFSFTVFPGG
ncbi:MAG: hypothetical protein DLM73_01790 [Chthoniobacterales bacterium]|nr:MAG: hypothetical protein DLM73_01790 [Chthoniobacterales bacterium]